MKKRSRTEKRKDHRYEVQIRIDYESKGIFESNYVTNIGRGGIFIQTEKPFPIRSEVLLRFSFPGSDVRIEALGTVVWTYDIKKGSGSITPGMGIRFTSFPPDLKAFLESYLLKLPKESQIP